jgi:hypothetical protein
MNCCDDKCNQGRDCPARVTKVGHRYPKHPQTLVDLIWRRNTRALARVVLLGLIGWVLWAPLLYLFLRE